NQQLSHPRLTMPDSPETPVNTNSAESRRSSSQFKRAGQVLNRVLSKLGLDQRLRENTLMNLWPVLLGEPWASRSRCLFIDTQGTLVVSVADASTGQELSLMKSQLLRRVNAAAQSMSLNIKGIRFDLKHFYERAAQSLPDIRLSEKNLP